jgi:hypothetical protein
MSKMIVIFLVLSFLFFGCGYRNKNNNSDDANMKSENTLVVKAKDSCISKESDIAELETKTEDVLPKILSKELDFSQKPERCDINAILQVDRSFNEIEYQDIFGFLYTFDEECSNNVEYSQFSNEILFKLFSVYPDAMVDIMTESKEQLNIKVILDVLKSPILDYDIQAIYDDVKNCSIQSPVKGEILSSLQVALGN